MTATVTHSAIRRAILLEDFQRKPPVQLHPRGSKQGPDRARSAALLPDYLAQIAGRDTQLKDSNLFTLNFSYGNLIRDVYQSFRDFFN
jgi:hypothetical protein